MTMRIFYKTSDGEIAFTSKMNERMLERNLNNNPELSYIDSPDGERYNSVNYQIDLDTLTVVQKQKTIDIGEYIRQRRRSLLMVSDWTQATDSPLSEAKRAEWAVYRQALRDLPDTTTATDTADIEWPIRPE